MLQERRKRPWGEEIAFQEHPIAHPHFHMPLYWSIFYQVTHKRKPGLRAGVTCHLPDDGQPSRTWLQLPEEPHGQTHTFLSQETPPHPQDSRQCPPPTQLMLPNLCPLMKASPPVVLSSPVSILKVVVLPAPLTPSSPKHSPGRTPTHSRSTARMRPILRDLYTCGAGDGDSAHPETPVPQPQGSEVSPCSPGTSPTMAAPW